MDTAIKETAPNGKRIMWMDIARTVAIFTVALNHAMDSFFNIYSGAYEQFVAYSSPLASLLESFMYLASRFGVPIFLMLTGALMLRRDYTDPKNLKRFVTHNWLSLVIAAVIWFTIYFWFLQMYPDSILHTLGKKEALKEFIHTFFFFDQTSTINMWYMKMIIPGYLIIPILSVAVKNINKKYMHIFMLASFVLAFIDVDLGNIFTIKNISYGGFSLAPYNMICYFYAYMLLGYYISEEGLFDNVKTYIVAILWIAAVALGTVYTYWLFGHDAGIKLEYNSSASIVTAILTFLLIKKLSPYLTFLSRPCTYISRISFGIFFVHMLINEYFEHYVYNGVNISPFISTAITLLASYFGSIIVIAILSRIPIFKKYLFVIK